MIPPAPSSNADHWFSDSAGRISNAISKSFGLSVLSSSTINSCVRDTFYYRLTSDDGSAVHEHGFTRIVGSRLGNENSPTEPVIFQIRLEQQIAQFCRKQTLTV